MRPCGSLEFVPACAGHQLCPALVESPMVAFAVALVTGPGIQFRIETLVPDAHLVTQRMPACDGAAPGFRAALPIVHVVLLESSRWAEHMHAGQAKGFLDLGRRRLVH